MKQNGVVPTKLHDFGSDGAAFASALAEARQADPDNGWCVSYQTEGELKGKLLFMDETHSIGFAVTADGDIEAVFKNKSKNQTRHAMDGVMPQIIALGGVKLDCYGAKLAYFYENYGMIPVARVEFNPAFANDGWDESKGTPDIYFMVHNDDSAETVAANIGKYDHMTLEQLEALPYFDKDSYDGAYAYRDSILEQRANAGSESAQAAEGNARRVDVGIDPYEGKSESGGKENAGEASVGAAQSGFDPLSHASNEYGTIKPGENPARVVDIPQSTNGEDRVSNVARTAAEAGVTTDSAVPKIEQRVMDGDFSHDVITNEETRQKAEKWLGGFDSTGDALLKWNSTAGRKKFMNLDDFANGIMVYAALMNDARAAETRGDTKSRNLYEKQALDVLGKLRKTATQAGQSGATSKLSCVWNRIHMACKGKQRFSDERQSSVTIICRRAFNTSNGTGLRIAPSQNLPCIKAVPVGAFRAQPSKGRLLARDEVGEIFDFARRDCATKSSEFHNNICKFETFRHPPQSKIKEDS